MEPYNHIASEQKWQQAWSEAGAFAADQDPGKDKAYVLDMFPYPSGSGLHVGHLLGYTGSDIFARFSRLQGKSVLHPMGWDAFGLPAENFAIKSGVHPAVSTAQNILEYKRQLSQAGMSYDWSKEMATCDPSYYKWTQWFFAFLYKKGLAYRKDGLVNWCPKCQTVLANEQVVHGKCERCETPVIQKQLKQWYFKITDYADRLLSDLDELDWPEKIKAMQRNWIGKSVGAKLWFKVQDREETIEVFTTRPDTIFGATYLVVAPEYSLARNLATDEHKEAVEAYLHQVSSETELERTFTDRPKTGVFTGSCAINPATNQPIPIWIADYVLGSYGTGAVMAVPAHDERDFAFAQKFELPIQQVVEGGELPITAKGKLMNSGDFSGQAAEEALDGILARVKGERTTTYRLRDWLVSRQRFWGAPIPIAYDEEGNEYLVPDHQLPVELPEDAEFLPTGQSPLTLAEDWKRYAGPDGKMLTREVDTLDTFVCSSWYYLRFPNPAYAEGPFDPEALKNWLPVDTYIGGAEHAVLHLLYARFFTKVLFDEGLVPFNEPFKSLRNQGMILGPDHNKMSKSKGNVINPDDVVAEFGADTLRTYEMFLAPFEVEKPWSTQGIVGVKRFLDRYWKLQDLVVERESSPEEASLINQLTAKVTEDIQNFRFNTAVAAMMETSNAFYELGSISPATYRAFTVLLNPFAPHITEEVWQQIGGEGFVSLAQWPAYDASKVIQKNLEYPVQINGKVRFKVTASPDASEEEVKALVLADARAAQWIVGEPKKLIVVPGRLVSVVI